MIATDRVLRDDRDRLVGRVVHDYQTLDRPTRGDSIEGKVHRPDLVRPAGPDQRLAIAHQDLLAPAAPNMQLLKPVQPLDSLVVHALAGLLKLQVDHPDAIAPMTLRQGRNA